MGKVIMIPSVIRRTISAIRLIKLKMQERSWNKRLKYLFFNNKSDTLCVVFSAFSGEKIRTYNYVRGLKDVHYDKLYILDVWGYMGSYYLFENGTDIPRQETLSLLKSILSRKEYKHVLTMGTSKGGTAAIYYGLTINASAIIAGACQYNLGNYLTLPEHMRIFRGMMGENAGQIEKRMLNSVMPTLLEDYSRKDSSTEIHLIYSRYEHTYEDDIIDLLNKLKECHFPVIEIEYNFINHNDVGIYFKKYIKNLLANQYRNKSVANN